MLLLCLIQFYKYKNEEEVYSLPAGDSYELQYHYPYIYECSNYTSIKKPLYFTFKKEEGIM